MNSPSPDNSSPNEPHSASTESGSKPGQFPPYAYVPGMFPHPVRDPRGHQYGQDPEDGKFQANWLEDWRRCEPYRRGIELFNHGYYWEAHEKWEEVWHAAGRRGAQADFCKGLIKLAAAGVKAREGRPAGVARHGRRAEELFANIQTTSQNRRFMGLDLADLADHARRLFEAPDAVVDARRVPVVIVMPFCLAPC